MVGRDDDAAIKYADTLISISACSVGHCSVNSFGVIVMHRQNGEHLEVTRMPLNPPLSHDLLKFVSLYSVPRRTWPRLQSQTLVANARLKSRSRFPCSTRLAAILRHGSLKLV
jgi:hypothetical protein